MKKTIFTAIFAVFISSVSLLSAQELLTPEAAVSYALNKNFDIILARNEADIAKINNNKATAGMLPTINVSTGDVFNLNNINQKFSTGQSVKKNWVPVNAFNLGLNLDWKIFDGMRMFAAKDRLEALQALGEIQLKSKVQDVVAQTLNAYYAIVQQKQLIKATKESSEISSERVNLAQKKLDVGYSDKTPLLQAQVDYSTQQLNILKQETALEQAKISLNEILGRAANEDFTVIDTIVVEEIPTIKNVQDSVLNSNYLVQAAEKNIVISKFQHKEIKAQRLPQINFSSSYSFNQNNSKAGLQLYNRSYGPTFGINATIPIFNGGQVKKQLEVSAVNIAMQQIGLDKIKQELDSRILSAFKNYEYAQKMLDLNENIVRSAQENIQISLERYRLNQSTAVEVKQAQSSYEEALYNAILARYNAKLAEIELKRLSNDLAK
ncbi:MAG: TolC family protein [Chitinophagales bacterium]|nr:TolC family protein [Bacteroidota bacterium]